MKRKAWPGNLSSMPSIFFSMDIPKHLPLKRGDVYTQDLVGIVDLMQVCASGTNR